VAIIGSIGPISTIILATIFLGEIITVFQLIGTAIVISGVMLVFLSKKI
jgi:drug/metabolite transporter (DMT)-like permease